MQRPIKLDQFLKLQGAAETGGEAKRLIQSGRVRVNGELETHRSRRLAQGDIVEIEDQRYLVEETNDDPYDAPASPSSRGDAADTGTDS